MQVAQATHQLCVLTLQPPVLLVQAGVLPLELRVLLLQAIQAGRCCCSLLLQLLLMLLLLLLVLVLLVLVLLVLLDSGKLLLQLPVLLLQSVICTPQGLWGALDRHGCMCAWFRGHLCIRGVLVCVCARMCLLALASLLQLLAVAGYAARLARVHKTDSLVRIRICMPRGRALHCYAGMRLALQSNARMGSAAQHRDEMGSAVLCKDGLSSTMQG